MATYLPLRSLEAIQKGVSSDKLCDIVADSLKISENQKFKYIETANLNQRLTFLLEDIEKERQLRANETYRREVVNAETENLYKQIKELRYDYDSSNSSPPR